MDDAERTALKARIDQLQIAYFVLFFGSLAVLAYRWIGGHGEAVSVWIVLLGSAVATRLYRNSLVNKYNAEIDGRLR